MVQTYVYHGRGIGTILFLLFVVMPIAEISLLVWITGLYGWQVTVAIVIVTAAVGALLVRGQGPRAWHDVIASFRGGARPSVALVAGGLFLVGAAFLVTPGVVTDAFGLLMMVPLVRRRAAASIVARFRPVSGRETHETRPGSGGGPAGAAARGDDTATDGPEVVSVRTIERP